MRVAAALLAAIVGFSGLSCSRTPATGLVIEIRSDLSVPDEINRVRFRVYTNGPLMLDQSQDLGTGVGRLHLPLRFALVPETGKGTRLTIQVRGQLDAIDVVTQAVTLDFSPGEVRTIVFDLARACLHVACPPGHGCVPARQTCDKPVAVSESGRPFAPVSGERWIDRTPGSPPSPWPVNRDGMSLAYHAAAAKVFVFGTITTNDAPRHVASDLWMWDPVLDVWNSTPAASWPLLGGKLVYDDARRAIMLINFGAADPFSRLKCGPDILCRGPGSSDPGLGVSEWDDSGGRWGLFDQVGFQYNPEDVLPSRPPPPPPRYNPDAGPPSADAGPPSADASPPSADASPPPPLFTVPFASAPVFSSQPRRLFVVGYGGAVADGGSPPAGLSVWSWDFETRRWEDTGTPLPAEWAGSPVTRGPMTVGCRGAVWDAPRRVLVCLDMISTTGGLPDGGPSTADGPPDTWEWSSVARQWTRRVSPQPASIPRLVVTNLAVRYLPGPPIYTAYHARRRSIFAWVADDRLLEWSTETAAWTLHKPAANAPAPKMGPLTYDSRRNRLVTLSAGHIWEWTDGE